MIEIPVPPLIVGPSLALRHHAARGLATARTLAIVTLLTVGHASILAPAQLVADASILETARGDEVSVPTIPRDALPLATDEDIRQRYRAVLAALAAGERDAALAALVDLEARAVAGIGGEALAKLEARQLGDLVRGRWQAYLPLTDLYLDSHRVYREHRRSALAAHAERMAVDLAVVYARRHDTSDARKAGARALAVLAVERIESGGFSRAEELLLQARELDPTAPEPLLPLAALHEKLGRVADAAAVLRSLHELDPEHREAKLRLAVAHRRLGERGAAQTLLDELRAGDDWIAVVAVEEAARIAAERHDWGAVARGLRAGLERFPEHPALLIPLAYALEREGHSRIATAELLALADRAQPALGERSRYNRWPGEAVASARVQLAAQAAQLRGHLAAALAAAADSAGGTP